MVQSLWFLFDDSALWCCTQQDSVVAARLRNDPRCAFEIAGDDPPYRGVRGRGVASLDATAAPDLLERLISRYLVTGESTLASWLRSWVSDEVVIRIGARGVVVGLLGAHAEVVALHGPETQVPVHWSDVPRRLRFRR